MLMRYLYNFICLVTQRLAVPVLCILDLEEVFALKCLGYDSSGSFRRILRFVKNLTIKVILNREILSDIYFLG